MEAPLFRFPPSESSCAGHAWLSCECMPPLHPWRTTLGRRGPGCVCTLNQSIEQQESTLVCSLGQKEAAQSWAEGLHTIIFTGPGLKKKTLEACEEKLGESWEMSPLVTSTLEWGGRTADHVSRLVARSVKSSRWGGHASGPPTPVVTMETFPRVMTCCVARSNGALPLVKDLPLRQEQALHILR